MVKNSPSSAKDTGVILGQGTKIPHAAGQMSTSATMTEPMYYNKDPVQQEQQQEIEIL